MSIAPPVQVYTADPLGAATPIMVDVENPPFTAAPVRITLSVAVAMLCPPGWPAPPSLAGEEPVQFYPRTLAEGTVLTVFARESAALVAAGAATLT